MGEQTQESNVDSSQASPLGNDVREVNSNPVPQGMTAQQVTEANQSYENMFQTMRPSAADALLGVNDEDGNQRPGGTPAIPQQIPTVSNVATAASPQPTQTQKSEPWVRPDDGLDDNAPIIIPDQPPKPSVGFDALNFNQKERLVNEALALLDNPAQTVDSTKVEDFQKAMDWSSSITPETRQAVLDRLKDLPKAA